MKNTDFFTTLDEIYLVLIQKSKYPLYMTLKMRLEEPGVTSVNSKVFTTAKTTLLLDNCSF